MAWLKSLAIFLTVAGTLMVSKNNLVSADCGVNNVEIKFLCLPFVQKYGPVIPPSQACCGVVKHLDIVCACKLITNDIYKYLDPNKAVDVGRTCGLTINPGMKCGSFTVPGD